MNILSFDPGHHIGISVWTGGTLIMAATVTCETIFKKKFLESLVRMAQPNWVVIEGIPYNKVDPKTAEIYHELNRWFSIAGFRIRIISPSQWKGLTARVKFPMQHSIDSATMAQWALENDLLEDNDDWR